MQALILAGGSGTRFWPASRRRRPKQLLSLTGGPTLLRRTFERLAPLVEPADVWVCTHRDLASAVARELPEVPPAQILAEPQGRNTAAAVAWSVSSMSPDRAAQPVLSVHSDHWVEDEVSFRETLASAIADVERSDLVLALGVPPRWAETGYGYVEVTGAIEPDTLLEVACFREKPDAATAERFLADGRHLWNSGIFLFRGTSLLAHVERLAPALARGLEEIRRSPERLAEVYAALPAEPIDTAVMEKLERIHTRVLDCGWNDLGSWQALAEVLAADGDGNRVQGEVLALDSHDNLFVGTGGLVAALGVEGLVVVQVGDAVLVLPRERSQEVRRLVAELARRGRDDLL